MNDQSSDSLFEWIENTTYLLKLKKYRKAIDVLCRRGIGMQPIYITHNNRKNSGIHCQYYIWAAVVFKQTTQRENEYIKRKTISWLD